nr:hypothetical protein CFP56_45897 [Quercus suber]
MAVVKDIASIVDMVDESETEVGDGEGYNFLQVQITVNWSISLCSGKKISWRDGSVIIRVTGLEEEAREYDSFTTSDNDESEMDKPSASPLALALKSETVRE